MDATMLGPDANNSPPESLARMGGCGGPARRHRAWLRTNRARDTQRFHRDLEAAARMGCHVATLQGTTGPADEHGVRSDDASVARRPFTRNPKVFRVRALTPQLSCKGAI